jgi:hypothetical protein
MIRNYKSIALIAALAVFAVSPGDAVAKKRGHAYSASLTVATLSTGNGYPGEGGTALLGGALTTSTFGAGASVSHVKITGQPASNVIAFKGTEVDYYKAGTTHNKFTGTSTVGSDGSQQIVITGDYDGGSGRYRGSTGHFSFRGTASPGSNVVVGQSSGKLVF